MNTPSSLSPFRESPAPPQRGIVTRLFRIAKPADAEQALANRLAKNGPAALSPATLSEDCRQFGVTGRGVRELLMRLWRQAVLAFLADDNITNAEACYLVDLRQALGLSDKELQQVEEELVHERFRTAVDAVVADGDLSASDRERLDQLAKALRLPREVAERVSLNARNALLAASTSRAVSDGRLSPQEMADLNALARSLDIQFAIDAPTQATFDRCALLWRIENGEPPVVSAPISLQRGETCHAIAAAIWHELRTRTQRINYGGPVASIRICKGLRYRIGSVQVQRITREELVEVDRGTLYLTNKRVIFDGARKNTAIRLSALLAFTPCTDGVILEKASGKSPHLVLSGDTELFHAILGAVLTESD
jgi:tellurite resistance protein